MVTTGIDSSYPMDDEEVSVLSKVEALLAGSASY